METNRKIGLLLYDYGSEYALDLEDGILVASATLDNHPLFNNLEKVFSS